MVKVILKPASSVTTSVLVSFFPPVLVVVIADEVSVSVFPECVVLFDLPPSVVLDVLLWVTLWLWVWLLPSPFCSDVWTLVGAKWPVPVGILLVAVAHRGFVIAVHLGVDRGVLAG